MTANKPTAGILIVLMLVLMGWAVFLAVGAFLGPQFWTRPTSNNNGAAASTPQQPANTFDYRKPLVVLAVVTLFVGGWGLALWMRQKRLAQKSHDYQDVIDAVEGMFVNREVDPKKRP